MISITTASVLLCVFAGVFFLVLWMYYDRRDHRMFDGERRRTIFHCVRCDAIYSERKGTEQAVCPVCGHRNPRLHF